MTQLIDDVAYLSEEIGARPAGTEEEQQAALFIAESLQRDSGFQAIIEDFSGMTDPDLPKAICFGVAFVCGLVALLVPLLMLPAAVISLVMAVLYVLEVLDRPVLSRFLKGGVSQNVVAKYQPAGVPNKRRKVILVANYDSGRVVPEQKGFLKQNRRAFEFVLMGGLFALVLLMLLRAIVFPSASGMVETVFSVLIVVAMVIVAVPVALTVMHSRAPYTEAANNNASGVSVLLDVARKVGSGCVSLEEMERMSEEEGVEVEGERAAREAGVVPDGAELEYRDASDKEIEVVPIAPAQEGLDTEFAEESEKEASASEEAGNAGPLQADDEGQSEGLASDSSEQSVGESSKPHFSAPVAPAAPFPTGTMSGGVPSWALAAQAKAHENKPEQAAVHTPAVRSRYADTPAAQILNREVSGQTGAFSPVVLTQSAPDDEAPEILEESMLAKPENEEEVHFDPEPSVPVQAPSTMRSSLAQERQRTGSFNNPWSEAASTGANSDLSARLAALRSEIQSAPVPHVSEEVRKAFDAMDELGSDKQSAPAVSRETAAEGEAGATKLDSSVESDADIAPLHDHVEDAGGQVVEGKRSEERSVPAESSEPGEYATAEDGAPKSEETQDEYRHEPQTEREPHRIRTSKSVRRASSNSFGGFMNKIHKVAENVVDAASEAGARIGEVASEAGSRFGTPASNVDSEQLDRASVSESEERLSVDEEKSEDAVVASETKSADSVPDSSESNELSRGDEKHNDEVRETDLAEENLELVSQTTETEKEASDAPAPVTSKTIHRAKPVRVQEEPLYDDEVESLPSADEPEAEAEISSGFDALDEDAFGFESEPEAVQAVDVSSFMNKPLEVSDPEPNTQPAFDVVDEATQPVSMVEVREAISQATHSEDSSNVRDIDRVSASERKEQARKAKRIAAMESEPVASPIVGLDPRSIPSIGGSVEGKKQLITLPEVGASVTEHNDSQSQRAPMSKVGSAHSPLVSGALPRIGADDYALESQTSSDRFGLDLPPLGADSEVSHEKVSMTSSFSTAGGTGAFAPVGDELVEGVPEENLYIDDADDSSFEENHTETGAFAGPEYVDLPQSRVGKFFGRFGSKKKKNQEENSMHEWIGTDEGYTAHGAGADRESWESFREDSEQSSKRDSGSWQGGAFNLDALKALSQKAAQESDGEDVDQKNSSRSSMPGEDSVVIDDFNMPADSEQNSRVEELNREMHKINEFRHPGIDTEVWFVALGSEVGSNSGMEAFLANHADELDGAIIVNLQALGAGKISYIDTEGILMPVKPSSRMKRFVRNAASRVGLSVTNSKLLSVETPASYAMRKGFKAFSIVGVKDGKPAHYAESEDRIKNISPKTLGEASAFVLELLKVM